MQQPSVGRIVHYVSYGTPAGEYKSECRAAVVTEIGEVWVPEGQERPAGTPVSLAVLNPEGMFFNRGVAFDAGGVGIDQTGAAITARSYPGGTWHWPERVD
jgi:hypothetical protein